MEESLLIFALDKSCKQTQLGDLGIDTVRPKSNWATGQGIMKRKYHNKEGTNMKRMILLVIALLMLAGVAYAQPIYGVKAGLNYANISEGNLDAKLAFHAGGFMQYIVDPAYLLQLELLYSRKGAEKTIDYTYDYLDLSLQAKYSYALDTVKIQPYIGGEAGYLLAANVEFDSSARSTEVDVKDEANSVVWGLVFGSDFVLAEHFILGVRYDLGLTNIIKDVDDQEVEGKFRTWMFSLGYQF